VASRNLINFFEIRSLSEYSDENMMDPYNIAICFGPTLVPVPEDKDQVHIQITPLYKDLISKFKFKNQRLTRFPFSCTGAVPESRQ